MPILVQAFRHATMKRKVAEKIHTVQKKIQKAQTTETQCYNNTQHCFHQPNKHTVFIFASQLTNP
jgi:hypothetical protein